MTHSSDWYRIAAPHITAVVTEGGGPHLPQRVVIHPGRAVVPREHQPLALVRPGVIQGAAVVDPPAVAVGTDQDAGGVPEEVRRAAVEGPAQAARRGHHES